MRTRRYNDKKKYGDGNRIRCNENCAYICSRSDRMEIMRIEKSRHWHRFFRWSGGVLTTVMLAVVLGCGNSSKREEADLIDFIMRYERRMVSLTEEINHTCWKFAETGSLRYLNRLDSLRLIQIECLHDAKAFAYLAKIRENGRIKDAYLLRQADILYRLYLPCQASIALQKQIIRLDTYLHLQTWSRLKSCESDMRDGRLQHASLTENKRLKKKWEDWRESGCVLADSILKLVRLRNEVAREVGYADYFSMYLELNELRMPFMDSLVRELKQAMDTLYLQQKNETDRRLAEKYSVSVSDLHPWHYHGSFPWYGEYPINQRKDGYYSYINIPDIVERFYSGIGFNIEEILARSNFLQRGDKIPVFKCVQAGDKNDIRIIGTISGTENDMHRLMGETGSAIYLKYIPETLPYLLRQPTSAGVYYGVSAFFARMTQYQDWILSMGILSVGQAGEIWGTTNEEFIRNQCLGCRWRLLLYDFEKQMYADPDRDLNTLWYALVREYFLTDIWPDSDCRPDWAADPYFVVAACEVSNHLIGELWAAQVVDYLCLGDCRLNDRCDFNIVGNKSVGKYFEKYIFDPGAGLHWEELTRTATQSPLSIHAFVEQFK